MVYVSTKYIDDVCLVTRAAAERNPTRGCFVGVA